MAKVAVIGSINIDLVVETDVSPQKGETIMGRDFFISPGGKGANQAVAAARLGGQVSMFGSLGKDENGRIMEMNLQKEKIDTSYINHVEGVPTGVAVIELCEDDNRIIVVAGANNNTNVKYSSSIAEKLLEFDVVIMQMEIPQDTIEYLVDFLYKNNKTIILNPAPAAELSEKIINKVTYITPNEHEYSIVLNTKEELFAVLSRYPNKLMVTRGEAGVVYHDGSTIVTVPSMKVEVEDTTGAGDTFSGAFGVAIAEGQSLYNAIKFANISAGLSITKKGAQGGMPLRQEVIHHLVHQGEI